VAKFTKATSEQAFFKGGLYGKQGSGKTLTSLLWAEGLAARESKRVAYIDTERGTDFYTEKIPERTIHPDAFDFDRIVTRSLMETLEAVEGEVDPNIYGVLVIDSVTHLWEAARNAYTGKRMSNGAIPIQAWNEIKRPYKRLMSLFLDGNFHGIICGREGVIMEEDEEGETKVTGSKMKAEGETPYEPHVLGRMWPEHQRNDASIIRVFFEKDRSGILGGKIFPWPNYTTIEPLINYLKGGQQGKLGMPEDDAEKDAERQASLQEKADRERTELFTAIRDALNQAHTVEALKAAWLLTTGKKGRLGEKFSDLETLKEARKAEILREVA